MPSDATVRVIVRALTEAAEQSIDDVGDEMRGLVDDAAVGQTGMDQLSDEFGEATAQSMILQRAMSSLDSEIGDVGNTALYAQTAMDQFSDEITETGTRAAATSGLLSGLTASMSGSAVASKALSLSFTLSLIPAIMTLATLLAPLVATITVLTGGALALAGAFGAIVGSGILAFGQKKADQNKRELQQTEAQIAQLERLQQQTGRLSASEQERLQQLRQKRDRLQESTTAMGALQRVMGDLMDELKPLIVQFGEQFVPLISDAVEAIPTLVENMFAAVGGTSSFKDALGDFGAALMEVLPALTGFMFALARDALPIAREFFGWLRDNAPGVWDAMMQSVTELEPELRNFLDALIDMGPALLEFGTTTAKVVLPALTALIRAATGFMQTVNDLPGWASQTVAGLLILAPAIIKVTSAFSGLLQFFTGGGILANLARLITYFSSASTVTGAFSNALAYLSGGLSTVAGSTAATMAGAAALGAAIGLVVVKILHMLGVMDMVASAGANLRDMLGGDTADAVLVLGTVLTGGLLPILAATGAAINELVQGDVQGAKEAFMEVARIFESAFANILGITMNVIGQLGGIIKNFFTKTLPSLVMSGIGWLVAQFKSGLNKVYNAFIGLWNGVMQVGENAMNGILSTIEEFVNDWIDHVNNLIDEANKVPGVNLGTLGDVSAGRVSADPLQFDRRETNAQNIRQQGQQGGGQTINGGVNVNVDARGGVQNNPYQWSRRAGQQVSRETRHMYGANNS